MLEEQQGGQSGLKGVIERESGKRGHQRGVGWDGGSVYRALQAMGRTLASTLSKVGALEGLWAGEGQDMTLVLRDLSGVG